MIKLNILLEELIMELTASEIREKYYSDIDANVFNSLVKADPGTVVKDDNIVKIGKYAKILINLFKLNNLKLEDLPKANEYLTIIYKKKIGLDANKITNLSDIYELVKNFVVRDGETDINKILESLTNEDYELKLNGEEWYIFKPLTIKGASLLGSATEWCTTWGALSTNPKHRDRSNRFEYHDKQGPMYIFINKKDNALKYQFHAPTSQYKNSSDRDIILDDFLTKNKEILLYFNPEIKTGIDNLEVDELTTIMNRPYINMDLKYDVIKIIAKKSDNSIVNNIVNALNGGEMDVLIEEINNQLSAADSDFKIYDIDSKDITFNKLEFDNLGFYDRLSRYDVYDDYGDDDEVYELGYLIDVVIKKRKDSIESDFLVNHIDLSEFLVYTNKDFDSEFISDDLMLEDFKAGIIRDLIQLKNEKISENKQSNLDALVGKAKKLFSIYNTEIKTNIFIHYLILNEGNYTYESFESFVNSEYDLPVEDYIIHEEIEEGVYDYNISEEELLDIFDKYESDIITNFIETNEDLILQFHNNINSNDEHENYKNKLDKLVEQIYFILKKFTNKTDTYLKNDNRILELIMNKIKIDDETIFIKFGSEINDNSDYVGYVKITDLPRYINYGEVSEKFFTKLKRILKDMGLNPETDVFENQHVKIDLDYSKVDEEKETIFIKFKNKDTGKELSGSVGIESLPTHFSNYKLFETINRFKRLI